MRGGTDVRGGTVDVRGGTDVRGGIITLSGNNRSRGALALGGLMVTGACGAETGGATPISIKPATAGHDASPTSSF